jgi:hypothetical protein
MLYPESRERSSFSFPALYLFGMGMFPGMPESLF